MNLYIRTSVILNTVARLHISQDPTFSTLLIDANLNLVISLSPIVFTLTALTNGDLVADIDQGILTISVSLSEPLDQGCYSLTYLPFVGTLGTDDTSITLNPGNLTLNIGETRYIDIVYSNPQNNWSIEACCIHPEMRVEMSDGRKIPIKNIRSGDEILNFRGGGVKVLSNISYSIPASEFVKIGKNSLGHGRPNENLFLTPDHPVLLDGKIISVSEMVGGNIHRVKFSEKVFSLCTESGEFVMVEGVPVGTFSKKEFRIRKRMGDCDYVEL